MQIIEAQFSCTELARGGALSDLAHQVRHDIDNPVTSILSLAGVIQQINDPSQALELSKRYAKLLSGEAWRISNLFQKFVIILSTRSGSENPTSFALKIRKEMQRFLDRDEFSKRKFNLEMDKDDLNISIAEQDAQFIAKELIHNALIHSTPDSEISISFKQLDANNLEFKITNNYATPERIKIQDIFKPFVTNSKESQHTGLGLTAVWAILERLQQRCQVQIDGNQFTFHTTLPLAQADKDKNPHNKLSQTMKLDHLKVLIVDDENTVSSAISKILEVTFSGVNHFSCTCLDGNKAIEEVIAEVDFNVILCDVNLKQGSGKSVYQQIQRARPDLIKHFAFITADATQTNTRELLKSTKRPCLLKPFEAEVLVGLVRKLAHGTD